MSFTAEVMQLHNVSEKTLVQDETERLADRAKFPVRTKRWRRISNAPCHLKRFLRNFKMARVERHLLRISKEIEL